MNETGADMTTKTTSAAAAALPVKGHIDDRHV